MKFAAVLIGLLLGGIAMPTMAPAAERTLAPANYVRELPFPRSPRAEAVWASRACWGECQSTCTWDLVGCLRVDAQGRCLKHTAACDRACQRDCRTRGGPYLPIE
jgi:hypothetical protein